MFTKPDQKQNFYELEAAVLKWWKENQILDKSIEQRPEDSTKTFYDGPITANGEPHHGHMLTFAMKDLIPRYWTMKGFRVSRSLGWDCQGLPVEYEIEKKLGFKEKKDIEKFGVAKFNDLCRQSVLEYKESIVKLEEMMGRLTNSEEEYATMDRLYIESVWWSLKELFTKGLLYEGFKVVPYSTRAGTTLSNAEVALGGYKKFVDPAITVEFPLKEDANTVLLAWTTTPWTIPGNLGLAVGKDIKYSKVLDKSSGKNYIVATDLVETVFKDKEHEVKEALTAQDLVGKDYVPPFDFYAGRKNAHKIYEGFHVTTDSGTGIVHLAPYGAEDNEIFQKVGIESFDYLDDQGDFTDAIAPYAGKNYRDANPMIVEDLKKKNVLFKYEDYEHDMPMCWRTKTPLIYKPITSWFVAMSTLRNELVLNNNKINWTPAYVKEGRFGNWLAEIKDWGISRKRYWGTPLPVWKSPTGKMLFIGSFEELKKYSGKDLDDPHRPYVDDISFDFEGETYTRIPDVIDVWYDSGAMPFARFHYPFENKDKFKKKFPADYIAESVDQTRGWFYTLHALGVALFGTEAFKNVVMSGFVLDDEGQKLAKSKGNYTSPVPMIEATGADTIRLNFYSTPISAGEDTTISTKTLKDEKQSSIIPLWNIYSYLVTYANLHNWQPGEELAYNGRNVTADEHPWDHIPFDNVENELDAWLLVRLQQTIANVSDHLDHYRIPKATMELKNFFQEISKWYIRTNRDRFNSGDQDALATLYYVFVETLKLSAPFIPFISEHIYKNLVVEHIEGTTESIHLADYPVADQKFLEQYQEILPEMNVVQKICELGFTIRAEKGVKVRQPVAEVLVVSTNKDVPEMAEWMREIIAKELNVKEVLDKMQIEPSDTVAVMEENALGIKIGMNLAMTPELKAEGLVRELTRQIQALRKKQDLTVGDKIKVSYSASDAVSATIEASKEKLMQITNATTLTKAEATEKFAVLNADGEEVKVMVEKV